VVVTSSISAYGMVSGEINEETPSRAANSRVNYQKTKWQAQEIARAAVPKGLEVVIMQPGAIMGPYDVGTWSRLFLMVRDDKLPGVLPRCSPSRMCAKWWRHTSLPLIRARTAFIPLGRRKQVHAGVGAPDRRVGGKTRAGQGHCRPVCCASSRQSAVCPAAYRQAAADHTEMVSTISKSVSTSSAKAQRELGYRVVPLKEMVKDCYDWMAAEGGFKVASLR